MRVEARGVVTAGGKSRRLGGRDKALLDLGDGPLLQRALARLRPLCTTVAVVGDPVQHGGFGAPVLTDRFPGCGPLAGLDAALRDTTEPFVLLLGCDLPFVGTPLLEALLGAPAEYDLVMPTLRGHDEPLCARYARRIHPVVEQALQERRLKMIAWYDALRVSRLPVETAEFASAEDLFNLNRPEDLEVARRQAARRRTPPTGGSP